METFHVSTDGNDAWSGRPDRPAAGGNDGPFRTLDRARDAVRSLEPDKAAGGVTLVVRGGVYPLTRPFTLGKEDAGLPDAPVVIRSAPREEVILTGGRAIPPGIFAPVTEEAVLARLAPAARDRVVQANLGELGISALPAYPAAYRGAPAVPELFFNDRRMAVARWPNEGWTTITAIVDPGSWRAPPASDTSDRGGIFEYEGDQPARWNVEAGVWLHGYWCFDWYDEVIKVRSIDRENRRIRLAAPAHYGIKPRNPAPRRWCALNLLEELDRPGEYYIDHASRVLYFWPPAPLAGARTVLSTLNAPVVAIEDAAHVILRGFTVEASLQNGIDVRGGCHVQVQACTVRNTRELGIHVSGGSAHKVEGCDVHDTGTGGITLSGGDRRTLAPAAHEAVNNHIRRFSQHRLTYSNALSLQGVGNRAAHNLIHDAPHQAIAIGGNDHLFECNIVHHVCMESDDCGALYKGRNPSCRGNLIRFNFWHHIGSPRGHGNGAIYFDDGDGGDIVFGNVFFRCCEPGRAAWGAVYSHGGHDIRAENNLFIECKRALGSAPWSDTRWQQALTGADGHDWPRRLREDVDITRPPYITCYPELVGFMDFSPGTPRVNRGINNVMVNCDDICSGNWKVLSEDNWVTDDDPGFVDAQAGDFRLRPDAPVFARLPSFQPIPFEKIGLVGDGR